MKTDTATYPAPCHTDTSAFVLYAPFLLLLRWMLGWAVCDAAGQGPCGAPAYVRPHAWLYQVRPLNRKQRRRPVRARKPGNDLRPFFSLLDDSHSKADFLEKVSRLSAIGRMALYGFRYWHKIRLSMTKLSPFYFGGWEALQSAIKSDGVWDVHRVPG